MRRKTIMGVIAAVVIVVAPMLCGCIDDITQPTPTPIITPSPATPEPSFEIEYPVTASFTHDIQNGDIHYQITLYEDGSGFFETPTGNFYGHWEVKEKTVSKIKYRFEFKDFQGTSSAYFALYSNHDAIWDPGADNSPGHWR